MTADSYVDDVRQVNARLADLVSDLQAHAALTAARPRANAARVAQVAGDDELRQYAEAAATSARETLTFARAVANAVRANGIAFLHAAAPLDHTRSSDA